jgi:hypothetical protein
MEHGGAHVGLENDELILDTSSIEAEVPIKLSPRRPV